MPAGAVELVAQARVAPVAGRGEAARRTRTRRTARGRERSSGCDTSWMSAAAMRFGSGPVRHLSDPLKRTSIPISARFARTISATALVGGVAAEVEGRLAVRPWAGEPARRGQVGFVRVGDVPAGPGDRRGHEAIRWQLPEDRSERAPVERVGGGAPHANVAEERALRVERDGHRSPRPGSERTARCPSGRRDSPGRRSGRAHRRARAARPGRTSAWSRADVVGAPAARRARWHPPA